jgi:predicted nucleic acid-binding protein
MSIVSNASPLINLARIGKFNLFHKLYGKLIVPEAVLWKEPGTPMDQSTCCHQQASCVTGGGEVE